MSIANLPSRQVSAARSQEGSPVRAQADAVQEEKAEAVDGPHSALRPTCSEAHRFLLKSARG